MKRSDHDPAHPPETSREANQAEPGAPDGLRCPRCGCRHFLVIDTRRDSGGIRRRRECRNCGWRIWTREEITPPATEMED